VREQEGIVYAERTDADVVLLRDEQIKTAQDEQHEHDHERVADDRAGEIAGQNRGHLDAPAGRLNKPGLSRASNHNPMQSATPCTHHIPTYSGRTPLSSQARLASRSSE